ncbi:MAG TPA: hypothetical protein VIK91_04265 [Nannocystis sp.]
MSRDFAIQSRCIDVLAEVVRQLGVLQGRVRIQKIMYLLRRSHPPLLDGVNFFYHHYGPYSSEVAGSLSHALSWRVLEQRVESFDEEMQRYEYRLGSGAANSAEPLDPASREIVTRVVKTVDGEHWRTLELAATIDFLEQSEHTPRDEALARALRLKPACTPFQGLALALLDRLALPPLQDRRIVHGR